MIKQFLLITSTFAFFIVHGAEDIKYASSQDIEKMQLQAAQYLTPLMEAVIDKDIDKISALVKQDDLTINAQDNTGQTALMWAITHELPLDIIKLLLSVKNIDLNIKDNEGLTALDHAIMNGNEEIVEAILNACELKDGICPLVNQRDTKLQLTPLARAAINNNVKIINLLLRAGANPKATVTFRDKTIPVSALYKDYTNRGLEVINALENNKPDEARKLLTAGIDVTAKGLLDSTPLHRAAENGHKDIVRILIENKSDVKAKTYDGWTPLHYAAYNGHKDIAKLLIDSKANVNAKTRLNSTPLHWAADQGHKDIVQLLLDNQADANSINDDGDTPMDLAALYNRKEIIDILKKAEKNK